VHFCDPLFEAVEVVPRAIPMDAYKVYTTTLAADAFEEGVHPVVVEHDGGAPEPRASPRKRLYFLHVQIRCIICVHVCLAGDVRLVESHEVPRGVAVQAPLLSVPFVLVPGSPVHRDIFNIGRNLRDSAILPMMEPSNVITCYVGGVSVVGGPCEAR